MLSNQLLTKLPWITLLFTAMYMGSLYLNHKPQLPSQVWHYYINHQQFQKHDQHSHISTLKLSHQGQGHYQPLHLHIKTKYDKQQNFLLDDLNHTHIDEALQIRKQQIKHAIIKSEHPINFGKNQSVRLLQGITVEDPFLIVCGKFFSALFPMIRNLILVGILFNQVDTFFPIIITTQSVLMLALLDNQKHYLTDFYNNIFNSNIDFFNAIRLNIFSRGQIQISQGNPLLTQYGFSQSLFYNISGQFMVALGFLMVTIFIKAGAALLKFQKLRLMSAKLRSVWNGFLFCLMPRILTLSSFTLRQMSFQTFQTTFYPCIAVGFLIVYLIYFIQLFIQIRRINQKVEYIEDSRNEIGLVTRLDYKHDFQFDCLQYSNLYYPVMNFLRLLLFFIPIGASYDFTYASFGGVIVSQLIFIMFSVSSSGFVRSRDSLVYPLCDFLLMLLQLSHIAVGLAQSVMHSEVSIIAEKVFFSLLLTITVLLLCSLAADLSLKIKSSCTDKQSSDIVLDKQLKSTKFKRTVKKMPVDPKQQTKTTLKTQKRDEIFVDQSIQDHESDNESPLNFKKTLTHVKPKIRKVRQGKII